jgi:hypothetical protein
VSCQCSALGYPHSLAAERCIEVPIKVLRNEAGIKPSPVVSPSRAEILIIVIYLLETVASK